MKSQEPQIVDAEDMSGHWPRDATKRAPPNGADAWKRYRKAVAKKFDVEVPGLRTALGNLPKEPGPLDVESAAALLYADGTWHGPERGVEYLGTRMSPVEVLKALLLTTTYRRSNSRTFPYWKALLCASAEERSEAQTLAEERWESASVLERAMLLSCFPDHAEWALELNKTPADCQVLLSATLQDLEALRTVLAYGFFYGPQLVNVVENLSIGQATEYLDECFERATMETEERATANALARISTAAAATVFVKHMRKKVIRARAVAFFTAHPELALGALGELAKKKTKLAATAREILERADRSDVSAKGPARHTETVPEANLSEVPTVLNDPRWPKKRKASKAKPLEGLAIPTEPCRVHWPAQSRQRHLIDRLSWAQGKGKLVSEPLARINEAAADLDFEGKWNLDEILAIHGDDVALAVASVIGQRRSIFGCTSWEALESPALATRLDIDTPDVWRWLRRYPEAAVAGLVPAALMAKGTERRVGEERLRWLQRLGHEDRICRAADGHGDKARSIIDGILEADPYDELPPKAPKMGKSYRPAELRAPVLKNGKRLPLVAVERLCEMLSFSPTTPAYVGIGDVREACTAASLSDFAWDLAKGWSLGGARKNEMWMLHAVEHYGDDEVVRRLTPELNGAGVSPMLGDIGTDAALMELGNIKVQCGLMARPPKYAQGHEEAIRYIALQRGMNVDELEEEYVPSVGGLDEFGALTLDLGPAKVRVTFDATLRPLLHDENGERIETLPRGKNLDPVKLKAAKSVLKELEQDARVIGLQRTESLHRALLQQRSWTKERFERFFVRHPLMHYMTRALIWQSVDGPTFRVAEDGSYADIDETEVTLPDDAAVRLCHALSLSAEERSAWAQILDDYDQIQPIEQLTMDLAFPEVVADDKELICDVGMPYAAMPDGNVTMPALGWFTTSQHSGVPIGDHIVILYIRHPKLKGRVLNKELKQIALKDASPLARMALARAFDALMTTSS